MSLIAPADLESARSETRGLMLAQLKKVVRAQKLPVSGSKAILQARIDERISEYAEHNDLAAFEQLRSFISDPNEPQRLDTAQKHTPHSMTQERQTMAGPAQRLQSQQILGSPYGAQGRQLTFKDSPFYIVQSPVTTEHELKVREATRDTMECSVRIPQTLAERFARGENLKVLVYCAQEPASSLWKVDVAFPNQIEMRVNGIEVKANFRGLKHKPGSTRPADITELIQKKPSYENTLTVTYALTNKKYILVVNVAEQIKPESLVNALKTKAHISKDQVLKGMANNAQDSEIQATSSILSLKCPLSTIRMDTPCRSTACTHPQCYDALSYLQLQEQAPTWACPVCYKPALFDTLQVDDYVEDILRSTSKSVDQVVVKPDGVWSRIESNQAHGMQSSSDNDDDLIEIMELPRLAAVKSELTKSASFARTPPQSSREQSTASTVQRSGGQKRPAAVIDLTLSDDEDSPPRAAKRRPTSQAGSPAGSQTFHTSNNTSSLAFSMPKQGSRLGF